MNKGLLIAILFLFSAKVFRAETVDVITDLGLIPRPQGLVIGRGTLDTSGILVIDKLRFSGASTWLAKRMLGVAPLTNRVGSNVHVSFREGSIEEPNGYVLDVNPGGIIVTAASETGAFYAAQTIYQLLTQPLKSPGVGVSRRNRVPILQIDDYPRFPWRGFMLDSSRHFQPKEDVLRWLDYMAMHKLNVFHWHLVDSHGWRLEIRKYPRLTSQAAWREQPPIGRYGGFYTQAEIREVVAYAAALHIDVVPEIEMPGHSRAAVAAYPELLACDPRQLGETSYFFNFPHPRQQFPTINGADVMCPSKETTYTFIADVLKETMELFPGKFIHVGGDEADYDVWAACSDCKNPQLRGLADYSALQSQFMQRIEKQLVANQRQLVGWDEIIEGGLSPTATVMSWRGSSGGLSSARTGHYAVMSPNKPMYLDHGQSITAGEPDHWPGTETLQDVYGYEPIPDALTGSDRKYILGVQGNLWSIFTPTRELLEIQAFPRLCAIAEVAWSSGVKPPFSDFAKRLLPHRARLGAEKIIAWDEERATRKLLPELHIGTWAPDTQLPKGKQLIFDIQRGYLQPGLLEIRFRYSAGKDALSIVKVVLSVDGKTIATDVHPGFTGAGDSAATYQLRLPKSIPAGRVTVRADVFVEAWAGGGLGDSSGEVTADTRPDLTLRTFALETPPRRQVTTTPVMHNRDVAVYDWASRHGHAMRVKSQVQPDVVVLGDSIMHFWGGVPVAPIVRGDATWREAFGPQSLNLGFGWDRTENVLWRLGAGELRGLHPRCVVVAIGTNNLSLNTAEEITDGIDAICQEVHRQLPKAKILVLGILPRSDESKLKTHPDKVNFLLQTRLHFRPYVDVYDAGNAFRTRDGLLQNGYFLDGLHPNAAGYKVLSGYLAPLVGRLKGLSAVR